jgi:hypothetical protein
MKPTFVIAVPPVAPIGRELATRSGANRCETGRVPMREDCRFFESRTYKTGEVARYCSRDLAPEEPWRCPSDCPSYERSVMRRTFEAGSLAPAPLGTSEEIQGEAIAEVLDAAEDIVNSIHAQVLAEVDADRAKRPWWKPRRRRS